MVQVAHLGAGAREDVRVELRLRRAVDVDAAREDALGAGARVRTAANGLVDGVGGAVRAREAGGRQAGIAPYPAADGVEVSLQQLGRGRRGERRRCCFGRWGCDDGPCDDVELAHGNGFCFSGQRMAGGELEERGRGEEGC